MDGRSGAELNPTGTWVTSTRHVQGQARHSRAEIQTECSLLAFLAPPPPGPSPEGAVAELGVVPLQHRPQGGKVGEGPGS